MVGGRKEFIASAPDFIELFALTSLSYPNTTSKILEYQTEPYAFQFIYRFVLFVEHLGACH